MPAADSLRLGGLPIGLAYHVELAKSVKAGEPVRWCDVIVDDSSEAVKIRREMETLFGALFEDARRAAG
jgi:predicted homoserine dehydrogenase-like protein